MRPVWSAPRYRGAETPAVYAILALFGICFILDFFTHVLTPLLAWPTDVAWLHSLQLWRPFTFQFVHISSFWYLVTDALVLYFFGGSLERAWGAGRFLFFFFASGIISGLVVIALSPLTGGGAFFGMVGSLMALVVAFASLNPYATVLLYFFPVQARWLALLAIAFELFGRTGMYGNAINASVAALVTAFFAYAFTVSRFNLRLFLWRRRGAPSLREKFDRWQQKRRMRQWQRKVSRIQRPDDLFKKDQ